mmetsp:Transcript_11822/g.26065  ORF Transcript_11822/g.26065 Transcript_11822/m.26065 type:complete len:218 (+) Transcript_11822:939-1592(+)
MSLRARSDFRRLKFLELRHGELAKHAQSVPCKVAPLAVLGLMDRRALHRSSLHVLGASVATGTFAHFVTDDHVEEWSLLKCGVIGPDLSVPSAHDNDRLRRRRVRRPMHRRDFQGYSKLQEVVWHVFGFPDNFILRKVKYLNVVLVATKRYSCRPCNRLELSSGHRARELEVSATLLFLRLFFSIFVHHLPAFSGGLGEFFRAPIFQEVPGSILRDD